MPMQWLMCLKGLVVMLAAVFFPHSWVIRAYSTWIKLLTISPETIHSDRPVVARKVVARGCASP